MFWSEQQIKDVPKNCTHDSEGNQIVDHVYGRPMGNGVLFGGDRILDKSYQEDTVSLKRNQEYVCSFLPGVCDLEKQFWTGLMPFTWSGKVYSEAVSLTEYPGLWFIGGFGPHGIMNGPGLAKQFAEEITQTKS